MQDLISRQAVLDAILQKPAWHNSDGSFYHSDDIKDAVNAVPPSPSRPQWIPCSERLPKEEGWYITTIENEKTGRRRIENDLFAIGIAEAHGNTPYKFCKDGHRQKTIAWMPLPEPYRGEGEK